jgi:UDP-glucuronate decarboxylase
MGTLNMLGLAKRVKARFLITSTSEVYGDPEEHPQREE